MSKDNNNKADKIKEINFNGAAILDKHGREIIVAEEMIESALESIKDSIIKPYQQY